MTKNNLLIVQPILTSYREPMLERLSALVGGELTVCANLPSSDFGSITPTQYKFIKAEWRDFYMFRLMPFKIFTKCFKRADKIIHFADFKYLSFWLFLFACFFTNKKIWLHGQGGYKKNGLFHKIVYIMTVGLSDGYICYTEYSAKTLKRRLPKFLHKKISVCDNTLDIKPVNDVNTNYDDKAIFYIGRLREGCGIENLLKAAIKSNVKVKIIGTGKPEYLSALQSQFSEIATFYGAIFDEEKQMEIAKNCMAGAYGGDAGLSVVHYMALGLPIIVHGEIDKHMGPEPSYVSDGVNGLNFERGNIDSLVDKITALVNDKQLRNSLALGALNTFKNLQQPSMTEKLVKIMGLAK